MTFKDLEDKYKIELSKRISKWILKSYLTL
jgi:hypothetical protein